MIADTEAIVTELFMKGRKPKISFAFISQSFVKFPEDIRPNATYLFIMKILKKCHKLNNIHRFHKEGDEIKKLYN